MVSRLSSQSPISGSPTAQDCSYAISDADKARGYGADDEFEAACNNVYHRHDGVTYAGEYTSYARNYDSHGILVLFDVAPACGRRLYTRMIR